MGVKTTAERWRRIGRACHDGDRAALDRLASMAMIHSSEAFYAFDDSLEAAVVSTFTEIVSWRRRS